MNGASGQKASIFMVKVGAVAAGKGRATSDSAASSDCVDRASSVGPAPIWPADECPELKAGTVASTAGYSRRAFDGAAASGAIFSRGQAAHSSSQRGN